MMITTKQNGIGAAALSNGAGNAHGTQIAEALPVSVAPRRVVLRDRITTATLIPFSRGRIVPLSLLNYLCIQLNREIVKGNTYAFKDEMQLHQFSQYWFNNFVGIMLVGDWGTTVEDCLQRLDAAANVDKDWERECLGSFFIKPNYPGRSSHICNGTFLVTDGARNRGVGRLMGEGYLEWAPKLGFTYSVFDLVYETNVASCRIWDALGFKRVGRIKGCGHLKDHEEPVDAIIYGRELSTSNPDDGLAEERFDRIKFYLKHQKYPDGIGRAEKSRLRSASTHYRLVADDSGQDEDKLFLRDKEVVADIQKQYEITRDIHRRSHEGINKSTARINEKYHWLRIKETATLVIKNCPECNEPGKRVASALNHSASMPEVSDLPSADTQMDMTYALPAPTAALQTTSIVTTDVATRSTTSLPTIAPDPIDSKVSSGLSSLAQTPSILEAMPLPPPLPLASHSSSSLDLPHATFDNMKQPSPLQLPPQQSSHSLLDTSTRQPQFPVRQQHTARPQQQQQQQQLQRFAQPQQLTQQTLHQQLQSAQQQLGPASGPMPVQNLGFPQGLTYDMSVVPVDPQIMAQMAQLQNFSPFMQPPMQQMPAPQQQTQPMQQRQPIQQTTPPQQQQHHQHQQGVLPGQHTQLNGGGLVVGAGTNTPGMNGMQQQQQQQQQQVQMMNTDGQVTLNPVSYSAAS